ncbi:hypothetical protein [Georgenia sp. Z1491]|uniref:hypothetical protein n=1 Tax=Georgenia sp. Z1491 TaxID=3416707 RepID=UPI003CE9FF8C
MNRGLALTTIVAAALLAVAGCGVEDEPEIDADGLARHACGFAAAAHSTPAEQWGEPVGPGTAEEFLLSGGANGLLGATTASPLEGYEELMEHGQRVYTATLQAELDLLDDGLASVVDACEEHGFADDDPDLSEEARLELSCALVGAVSEDDRPAEDWLQVGARAGSEEGLLMAQMSGFTGLLGASHGWEMPGHEELSEAAQSVHTSLTRIDADGVDEGMRAAEEYCSSL